MVRAVLALFAVILLIPPTALLAADGGSLLIDEAPKSARPIFVNYKVSSKTIAVNQPLRLEFTTVPRQLEGVDIAAVVSNGIELSSGGIWKLLAKPTVSEHEKLKTVTVVVSLLPRTTGDLRLPQFPLSWLIGDPLPEFGLVSVGSSIVVGGETRPLPSEYQGLGGVPWGATVDEAKSLLPPETTWSAAGDDSTVAAIPGGLSIAFRGELLASGVLVTPGMTLAEARSQLVNRWGLPVNENGGSAWYLGWTRIQAFEDHGGFRLVFEREDQLNRVRAQKVKAQVFSLLEGTPVKPAASTDTGTKP